MERTKIDRWSAGRLPAAISCCVVQATLRVHAAPGFAAQNEPEDVIVTGPLGYHLNNYDGTLHPVPSRFFHARAALKF